MRRRGRQQNRQGSIFDLEIHPETKLSIFAILVFLFSVLGILSYFGKAGQVGQMLDSALAVMFGYDRIIVPLITGVVAILILKPIIHVRARHIVGLFLFLLSLNGFIHILTFDFNEGVRGATLGEGGGYIGVLLSYPLDRGLGFFGGVITLLALIIISLMLTSRALVIKTLYTAHTVFMGLATFIQNFIHVCTRIFSEKFARNTQKYTNDDDFFQAAPLGDGEPAATEDVSLQPQRGATAQPKLIEEQKPKKIRRTPLHIPIDLLSEKTSKPSAGDVKTTQLIIQKTLENFSIEVEMGEVSVGPTVTQYTLKPAEGIKLSRITALSNDLALALAAHPIRIEAPIPGKSLVGIEVPNQQVARVPLREILESDEWKKSNTPLTVALGKDVSGKAWIQNLARMPHMLVAGATGSGKTVSLNAIIMSLLFRNQPERLKFILIDPKRVELPVYNGIPHLLAPVITEVPKVVNALRWTIGEMERRFDILAKTGKRDIESYNAIVDEPMPYLILIIDELADLMVAAGSEAEGSIIRLAQMARAVGIHLIIATQRPSVDVITGLIKANITARMAFAVASQTDSRTILDAAGAEKLLGRGDMLFTSAEISKPKRIQGAFVSDEEIVRITEFLKKDTEEITYDEHITEKQTMGSTMVTGALDDDDDPLFPEARDTVVRAGKASASLLQRRLKVGYARAARLLDIMEEQGIIGPADGAKPRDVLILQNEGDTIIQN